MFKQFPEKFSYSDIEREVLEYWSKNNVFEKSISERSGQKGFTFYEGPPTVNGRPGIHHVMARTLKDIVCRYKTMTGHQVHRKAGWDTHGLPIEIALEKELGFTQKSDIEKYGVAAFNAKAKELVYHHIEMKEGWRTLTERMGYWINLDDAYITCTNEYIESVWWALSEYFKKGLIYRGFKIVPQCPHCETPLSSHELAQGYDDVKDPNVFIKFRCVSDGSSGDEDASFLVWTTTPWTLISNVALAVHPDVDYVKVHSPVHGNMYLAKARLSVLSEEVKIIEEMKGSVLLNRKYEPLFNYVPVDKKAWYVVAGDFVSTEDGTGIVHIAPAFGADDYEMSKKYDLPFVQPVTKGGRFTDEVTDFAGRLVKTIQFESREEKGVDPDVIKNLKQRGLIYRATNDYIHSYPHCWRCDNPLIYYARDSWYIRTTEYARRMIELNREINWCPPEVGSGRFGNWLEENKDWSLSRDRYWGTPLPIWLSEDGDMICIGSIAELKEGFVEREGKKISVKDLPIEEIDLHKPFVDSILFERDGKIYRRTPELIDAWFDSGAMPFAQFHYPFENKEWFEQNFPADFICEGIDQTRGWFYTLHAISSAIFNKPAFKNVIVNELILDKDGQKMSKSKGNVADPFKIIEKYGADATRWYLVANSPPWRSTMFNDLDIEGVQKNFFRALINTYQFYALYANIDGFTGGEPEIPIDHRPEIDRWILSELSSLIKSYHEEMESYDLTPAARAMTDFTVDQLSNWYVRRNRRRFWKGEMSEDKLAAYQTLFTCIKSVITLMAPFAPFLSEYLYQNLKSVDELKTETDIQIHRRRTKISEKHFEDIRNFFESVHLAYIPESGFIDKALETRMHHAERVVSVARSLREKTRMKTRQPLSRVLVATHDERTKNDIRQMQDIILEELNVKQLEFVQSDSELVKKKAKPNFKIIGPKYGKSVSLVANRIKEFSMNEINTLESTGRITINISDADLTVISEDVEILHEDIEGWIIGTDNDLVVALDTHLTDELLTEGYAREFVSKIQNLRKQNGFEVTDRITIQYHTESSVLQEAIVKSAPYIRHETLAINIDQLRSADKLGTEIDVNGEKCNVVLMKM